MQFIDVLIREAHPGAKHGLYRTYEDKMEAARLYKRDEGIGWPVLVDDLQGTVHRMYSREMADPSFLIDSTGRIAFYCMWTHAPSLKKGIDELLARGGEGAPVAGGIDRTPHLLASFADGYPGPARAGHFAVAEYNIGGFGAGWLSWLGYRAKPILAPVALRVTPLPLLARIAIAAVFLSLLAWLVLALVM